MNTISYDNVITSTNSTIYYTNVVTIPISSGSFEPWPPWLRHFRGIVTDAIREKLWRRYNAARAMRGVNGVWRSALHSRSIKLDATKVVAPTLRAKSSMRGGYHGFFRKIRSGSGRSGWLRTLGRR